MKEVVRVSLSGIAFVLEHDAYTALSGYLDKLAKCYANSGDSKEILADIESRIVELILSKQPSSQVVGRELIDSIVEQLGMPDETDGNGAGSVSAEPEMEPENFPRRLYRNSEGAKLGGVCSGIATFFHIDVVWVRIMWFVPLFLLILAESVHLRFMDDFMGSLFGVFVLLYFVLWIIVPMARSPRQKLEMGGRAITANSIREEFSRDAQQMSRPKNEKLANTVAELLSLLGRLLIFFVKAVAVFIGLIFAVVALSIAMVGISILFGLGDVNAEFTTRFAAIPLLFNKVNILAVCLFTLLPLVAIIAFLISIVVGFRRRRGLYVTLGIIWLVVACYMGFVFVQNASELRQGTEIIIEEFDNMDDHDDDGEVWRRDTIDVITTEPIIESDSTKSDTVVISIGTK